MSTPTVQQNDIFVNPCGRKKIAKFSLSIYPKAMKTIVVFCGNRCDGPQKKYFFDVAYQTGKLLAESGFVVATGGGEGLMDAVLRGAVEAGGTTIGVQFDVPGRRQSTFAQTVYRHSDIVERGRKLQSLGDAFIALPGGVGTIHEIFDVMVQKKVKHISADTPMIVIGDYFNFLKNFSDSISRNGFSNTPIEELCSFSDDTSAALHVLKNYFSKK